MKIFCPFSEVKLGLKIFIILPFSQLGLFYTMWISWVENVVNKNVCPIIEVSKLKIWSMSMLKDTIDLADVHITFCCGVTQNNSHQAPVQSTPPGWAQTTVGLSTWSVLFMARICSAAGSAWWEELEPSSLHKKLQFSFQQSGSGTQSFDLRPFLFQYDWYTKKTTVVVDVINRSAEGDKYLLLALWLPVLRGAY